MGHLLDISSCEYKIYVDYKKMFRNNKKIKEKYIIINFLFNWGPIFLFLI